VRTIRLSILTSPHFPLPSQVQPSPTPLRELSHLPLYLLSACLLLSTAALLLLILLRLYPSRNRAAAAFAVAEHRASITPPAVATAPSSPAAGHFSILLGYVSILVGYFSIPVGYFSIPSLRAGVLRLSEALAAPIVAAALYIWPELEAAAAATPTGGIPGEGPQGWGVPWSEAQEEAAQAGGGAQAGGIPRRGVRGWGGGVVGGAGDIGAVGDGRGWVAVGGHVGGEGWSFGGGVRGARVRTANGAGMMGSAPAARPVSEYRWGRQ
jgi:hypothetical protein